MDKNRKIVMSLTTCKRYTLFERALQSFVDHLEDLDLIDEFILVDDSSCKEDRDSMLAFCRRVLPGHQIDYVFQEIGGLEHSLHLLYKELARKHTYYSLHLEDDWVFQQKDTHITNALKLIETLPEVTQVCYSTWTHFFDPADPYKLRGKHKPMETVDGINFYRPRNMNWTTSPHLMDFKTVYSKLGDYPIISGRDHEMVYRMLFHAKGMRNVFLAETGMRNIANVSAYTLNKTAP